jgi:NitT/TauT family transport system substrate-binding protein
MKILALILIMLALFFNLLGCTQQPTTPLTIGTCIRIGCEPFYMARELGYFNDAPIRIVEYKSATEVQRAFRNGAINSAVLSLDEVLQLSQYVSGIHVVLVLNYSNGADVILGQKDIDSLEDLAGKRVGVENTALGAYVLARALALSGLKRSDIVLVPLPVDQHERAFLNGNVDAIVTFEPIHSRLEAMGAHHLFDSRQIPKEMANVLAVRATYLNEHPDVIQALLHGWFLALDQINSKPKISMKLMAESRHMSRQRYTDSLKGYHFLSLDENRWLFSGAPSPLQERLQTLSTFMHGNGLLDLSVELSDIPDSHPIDAIHPNIVKVGDKNHAF